MAHQPDALWETVLSLHQLSRPNPFFAPWCRRTRSALTAAGLVSEARMLTALAPRTSYFPDFLTPTAGPEAESGAGAGIDRVLSTGRDRLRADIARLAAGRSRPSTWLDEIAAGRTHALRRLGAGLHRYYDLAVAPHAAASAACVGRDRRHRARDILDHGSERLLANLGPTSRWRPPVLEVDYSIERELHLEGRGLTIIPSFFCHDHPITLALHELPPVLVYPVARGPLWIPESPTRIPGGPALDELLGATRAAVLRSLATGHSTTTLAARLRISTTAASRHAAALRAAGLVATERRGASVRHSRTSLGTELVDGGGHALVRDGA
ncbi:helix-turn-helix domain-containing protein [Streptomyces sp. C11-1]|uniref:Helix-turn-helix domain-containing protein n=1 Tax=Streptomyces durocortorensis TaxID=2811104 RepID=A0ABY9W3U7_9ACTN|nr:helix-turn-helix domain-containing protein [Streptomyces durocortorensis]WNF30480.1 helix-turn-helix domain-containing protein [Streptomyces durocortorensis]